MDKQSVQEGKQNYNNEDASEDNAFMKGFMEDNDSNICEECDSAVEQDSLVSKVVDGGYHLFCSESCVEDYEESI